MVILMDAIHDFIDMMIQTPQGIAALIGMIIGIIVVIAVIVISVVKKKKS